MQKDGNLVLYCEVNGRVKPTWASQVSWGKDIVEEGLRVQEDGNLVLTLTRPWKKIPKNVQIIGLYFTLNRTFLGILRPPAWLTLTGPGVGITCQKKFI